MSWQAAALSLLALTVIGGFAWYERSRPSARIVAAIAALAALGVAGRVVLAPIPNVVATTDVALLAGYTLGGGPGFAVGALSALVSNFWLGQGPWTPWQMAGWGMVGVCGALLARGSGRKLGRVGLALAGATMGFAYGALLDLSVMVNYGGEQSLDRYLALSARGIPFNVAHAAGNAVLMLAAGPAMVRMLDRYRDRFEVRWSERPLARAAAGALVAMCLLAPLLSPARSGAATGETGITKASGWLERAQNDDGGFGTDPDADSSPGMTGWAMLGLEAAGVNPRDVLAGGKTPVGYLRANASQIESTADLERTILALDGAGVDPRAFDGIDLVARLRERQSKDGSFEHQVNLTAFAILAQRAAGVEKGNVGAAAAWLRGAQNRNGGWGSVEDAESEPDSTGAALQALAVSPGGSGEMDEGARWLEQNQKGDGGWSLTAGASSNVQSTAWAIQGLVAGGKSPDGIRNDGRSGLDYLSIRQDSDGHYTYSSSSDQTPVWVTAQGLTGAAREPFPIAAVPVEKTPEDDGGGAGTGTSGGDGTLGDAVDDFGGSSGSGLGPADFGFLDDGDAGGGSGAGPDGPAASLGGGQSTPPPGADLGVPGLGEENDEGETIEAEQTVEIVDGSPLPATGVWLGALGVLAAGLGTGFFWYRRRLP